MSRAPAPTALPKSANALEAQSADSMAANLTRAEIDQQIATAKKYPRSITAVMRSIEQLACLDEITAAECIYELPRDGKKIRGPSVRFAEIVLQAWGNCRVASRVTNEGRTHLEATGIYHDLESNMAVAKSITQRITKSNGDRYGDDMIGTASQAATSKALRNAILVGIPKGVWRPAFEKAQATARGTAATLTQRRAEALQALKALGAAPNDVFEILGVKGEADITLDLMVSLRGVWSALNSNETTLDAMLADVRAAREPAKPAVQQQAQQTGEGFDRGHVDRETTTGGDAAQDSVQGAAGHDPATGEVIEGQHTVVDEGKAVAEVATSEAALEATVDETEGQAETDSENVFAGPAPQGTRYLLSSDEPDENDSVPVYLDGAALGLISVEQAIEQDLPTYDEHAQPPTGQQAEAEQPAAGQQPQEEDSVLAQMAKMESWLQIRPALIKVYDTAEFKALPFADQIEFRRAVAGLVQKIGDPVKPTDDAAFFRVWMDTQEGVEGADAIEAMYRDLKRAPAYAKVSAAGQETLKKLVEVQTAYLRKG